jgi:hypothetical protein
MEIMRRAVLVIALVLAAVGVASTAAVTRAQSITSDGARTLVWSNGDSFTGEFRDGRPNGPGVFRSADGEERRGQWRDGCLVGDQGWRIAVLTRLSDCPAAPPQRPSRPKLPPHADFFR